MAQTRITVPLIGSTYNRQDFVNLSQRRLLNMYIEERPDLQDYCAIGFPGFSQWTDTNGSVVRGMLPHIDLLYVVTDNFLYSINTTGNKTLRGTLTTTSGDITMTALNDAIVIADGTDVYNYKISTQTFSNIADADLPNNVQHITSVNEYVLYLQPDTAKIYVSDLSDATSLSALSFFTCGAHFDNVLAIASCQNRAYMFGAETTEIWFPSGQATGAPFDRESAIQLGILSPLSHKTIGNNLYWLARNKEGLVGVAVANGPNVQIITNRDFVAKVNSYSKATLDSAFGWVDQHNGHTFYNLTFPAAGINVGHTFSYDLTTGAWSERTSYDPDFTAGASFNRYIASCSAYFNNMSLIGSYQSGKIYEQSQNYVDAAGQIIEREVVSNHLNYKDTFFSGSNCQITFEGGLGNTTEDDPIVEIFVSKDYGHTYSNPVQRKVGKTGEFKRRARVGSLGGGNNLTLKIRMTDKVKWKILNATMDVVLSDNLLK